jgi:hypothetical protein
MTIEPVKLCGPFCVDPDDGAQVAAQLVGALQQGDSVCLDFTGVSTLTSSFLNAAVGSLYGHFDADFLDAKLTWSGMDATDESLIRLVRDNAIRYFSASPEQRQQLAHADAELVGQ